jgi:hypothetical protein
MGNTFMLLAAGATPTNMKQGFALYRSYAKAIEDGVSVERWVASLPESAQSAARIAADTMDTFNGGRTGEALSGYIGESGKATSKLKAKGNRLHDNKALRVSRNWGKAIEGSGHFMLGYDGAMKGLDGLAATARTKRFLFDYGDLSQVDKAIKDIVPFWIWFSRNLPMQLVNQWSNPKAYAKYHSLMRNMAVDEEDKDGMAPSWLKEQGGAQVSDDWWLTPDLGFNRLQETASQLQDPKRLLSMVNPGIRAPLEVLGGKRLYNDVPFSNDPQQIAGGPFAGGIGAVLEALGQAQRNSDGELVTNDKTNYLLSNLFPPVAQGERLMPAQERNEAKQNQAILSYFGVPVRKVTDGMRESEQERRAREIRQLATSAKALGYTP